jgi:hypothetical protein
VNFWTDAGKTASMSFNYLRTTVETEISDRVTAVAASQAADEATAATALAAEVVLCAAADAILTTNLAALVASTNSEFSTVQNDITNAIDALSATIAGDIATEETARINEYAALDSRMTAVEAIADGSVHTDFETRIAALEALIAATNAPPA